MRVERLIYVRGCLSRCSLRHKSTPSFTKQMLSYCAIAIHSYIIYRNLTLAVVYTFNIIKAILGINYFIFAGCRFYYAIFNIATFADCGKVYKLAVLAVCSQDIIAAGIAVVLHYIAAGLHCNQMVVLLLYPVTRSVIKLFCYTIPIIIIRQQEREKILVNFGTAYFSWIFFPYSEKRFIRQFVAILSKLCNERV